MMNNLSQVAIIIIMSILRWAWREKRVAVIGLMIGFSIRVREIRAEEKCENEIRHCGAHTHIRAESFVISLLAASTFVDEQ